MIIIIIIVIVVVKTTTVIGVKIVKFHRQLSILFW